MTFADVPINEPFKDGGVTYTKLSDATADISGTALGPRRSWHKSDIYCFDADDPVEEWTRWRLP